MEVLAVEEALAVSQNRLLRGVIAALTSDAELDAVLASVIDLVTDATGGDVCVLHLWDPAHDCLVLRAASPSLHSAVGEVRLRLGEGVTGWAAEHRQVVVIPEDKWADPRYKYFPELQGERYTSMISVPLVARSGDLLGVLNVHARERRDHDLDLDLLKLTASLVSGAIEHAGLFGALAEKEAALAGMMRRTIEAQEEERRRVATEIHDGVTQQLVSIWYRLLACGRSLATDRAQAARELEAAKLLVDEALGEARNAIHDLRPSVLDDLGLAPALRALAYRQLAGRRTLELDVADDVALPAHHEVVMYRVAQEAITNICRHSRARRVKIALYEERPHVVLVVGDDGCGFDPAAKRSRMSFGLTGMAERVSLAGGRLSVHSASGRGTVITVLIPGVSGERP
jgi:two-component system NarL family sensor kinase